MDDDRDLRRFSNRCRLFPLPKVVLFPHAVLPLHIFEPRYRQMTEDALADDNLVAIVQQRVSTVGAADALGSPPIERVACLGRILKHERLPDGRFNFLLLGRKRVRLTREVPTDRLYRVAEAEILDDLDDDDPEPHRSELIALFRRAFERQGALDSDLADLLDPTLPLGVLTDIVTHALGLPAEVKQLLLAETRVPVRSDTLLSILRRIAGHEPGAAPDGRSFPPPFSLN